MTQAIALLSGVLSRLWTADERRSRKQRGSSTPHVEAVAVGRHATDDHMLWTFLGVGKESNMKKFEKNFKSIISLLEGMVEKGVLEPGQFEAAKKMLKSLRHGLKVRDLRKVRKAINGLARMFVGGS